MNKKVTYHLIAKYLSGNSTETEKEQVESWKNSTPANLEEFNQYHTIWENAQKPASTFTPNVESALNKVTQNLTFSQKPVERNNRKLFINYSRRIAAALLLGIGIWFASTLFRTKQEPSMLVAESTDIRREITLSDGTHIWLNKNSMVRYPEAFKGSTRNIYIEGEAYFDVAKNANMPFIIKTDQSVVTVLGTEFNLRARKDETLTIVTVTEGRVSFNSKKNPNLQSVYLMAGDKGLLNTESQEMTTEKNQDANFLAWKTGKLVFKNTPLGKVTSDLSDYFNKEVIINDTLLSKIPFTSTFDHQSLHNILHILEISLSIKVDSTGSVIILK